MYYLLHNCWFSLCGTCCCQHDWLDDLLMYETRLLSLCILLSSEIVQMRHFRVENQCYCCWVYKLQLILKLVEDMLVFTLGSSYLINFKNQTIVVLCMHRSIMIQYPVCCIVMGMQFTISADMAKHKHCLTLVLILINTIIAFRFAW